MRRYGRAADNGRMGTESSQLRSIKTSSKALGCCILVAANLQNVAANLQTLPPVPELVNEPILKIGAV
jgi:hypothetical protein